MDELGVDRALMFPTLASLVEERMKDDPELILDMIHALNQWMYETWQFDYEGRIFATPVIFMGLVDKALEERCEYLIYLGCDPMADDFKGDPRFKRILARIGLPTG